ncbi:MAG TPA: carboxypeptidase-like regulatory domain-containing protein, partial [Edaphobacter sp.]|nr:carboxypeptidase-like regulatory domain-containing protein [Edaphobacter sp.]
MKLQRYIYLLLLVFVSAMTPMLTAQTYRGGIAGTVEDSSGAAVPNAHITLTGMDTGFKREMDSTTSGAYSFQDLQIGNYSISVTASGFSPVKIDNIAVRPGQVFSLDPKMSISGVAESIEVSASALALDTVSSTNNNVVNDKAVENIPLNGRDFTQLIKITPGVNGAGSVNGTRTNQNNYQIDGADNNDIWQNATAANQGGVAGIAGVTIPVESIDQFTVQSSGNAEAGRNTGGLITLAIKTGGNSFHGSAYYYNRNEFFAARSPFTPAATRKPKLRNQQFGGSLGGPIMKDKLFFFVNYERQMYTIQNSANATEPVAAYVAQAQSLLAAHNVAVNPLSVNLLQLWPAGNAAGYAATQNNYVEKDPQHGYSDN